MGMLNDEAYKAPAKTYDAVLRHDSRDGQQDDNHADPRDGRRPLAKQAHTEEDGGQRLKSSKNGSGSGADVANGERH